MKKIIHLSDLHIGSNVHATKPGDLIEHIIIHMQPSADYVIVITGDIVNDATRQGSYEEACVHLNRLKDAGFLVLVVPGNHDYGTGVLGYKKYVALFKKLFYGTRFVKYPKLNIIDNIAFIGLDSMSKELHWYDRLCAEGELGKKQLKRLGKILEKDAVKKSTYRVVYLHHHPLYHKPFNILKDDVDLKKKLEGHAVDALLFGHNHDGRIWNGRWGIKRVYDGGTSTGKGGKPAPHRVIDLSKECAFDYEITVPGTV